MKRTFKYLLTSTLVAFVLAGIPAVRAADSNMPPAAPSASATAGYPLKSSLVDSVDVTAKTITLKLKKGPRVLKTDAKTKIEYNGKTAMLSDIKSGYYVTGYLHKDGTNEVATHLMATDTAPVKKARKAGTNMVDSASAATKSN